MECIQYPPTPGWSGMNGGAGIDLQMCMYVALSLPNQEVRYVLVRAKYKFDT